MATDLTRFEPFLPESRRPLLGDNWLTNVDAWDATLPPLSDPGRPAGSLSTADLREETTAVRAGLLLMSDADTASHEQSQTNEGDADCDYWHGIMHRREPDYGNAGYWFRLVGQHPAMESLPASAGVIADALEVRDAAAGVLGDVWSGHAMIDLCRTAERQAGSPLHLFARAVQWAEMRSLLTHCDR